jgi:hypothetical protein
MFQPAILKAPLSVCRPCIWGWRILPSVQKKWKPLLTIVCDVTAVKGNLSAAADRNIRSNHQITTYKYRSVNKEKTGY